MDGRTIGRGAAALWVVVMVVGACSMAPAASGPGSGSPAIADPPSPIMSPTGSPRPTASPRPTSSPRPAPTPSLAPTAEPEPPPDPPTATATPVPQPPDGSLVIDWASADVRGLERITGWRDEAARGSTWVIAGETEVVAPDGDTTSNHAIWRSKAGSSWEMVLEVDDGTIAGMASGGSGFVAVGSVGDRAAVWLSSDGRAWRSVDDDAFPGAGLREVGVSASGFVAFGYGDDVDDRVILTSPDGTSWLRATNASGLTVAAGLQALLAQDGRLTAFVGLDPDGAGGIQVWTTTGRAEWRKVGDLPGSDTAWVDNATHGPRGWVAVGRSTEAPYGPGIAWRSDDGETWQRVEAGPDTAVALLADDAGFIASGHIGSLPGETCGDPRPFQAQTWTSTDGWTWRQLPVDDSFESAHVSGLFRDGRTLTGVGLRHDFDTGFGPAAWTADLPGPSEDVAPPTTPSAVARGCGG